MNVDLPWGVDVVVVFPRIRCGKGGDCSGEIFRRPYHPGRVVVALVISNIILVGLLLEVMRGVSIDFQWDGRIWRRR